MKVLVTGARGYIGSHIVQALSRNGHTVVTTDLEDSGNNIQAYSQRFFSWDIRKSLPTSETLNRTYDSVVHCAALVSVEESMKKPSDYYLSNTFGTLNVIHELRFEKFVFASTGGAFAPVSPYAKSKIAAEEIIRELCPARTVLRFFNVGGSNGFKNFNEPTHLLRKVAMAVRGEAPQVAIYGNDYETKDGTCVRDYIHVSDVANAVVMTVEQAASEREYECLGSGKSYTVKEVIATMKQVSGVDFSVSNEARRVGDPAVVEVPFMSHFMTPTKTLANICEDTLRFL